MLLVATCFYLHEWRRPGRIWIGKRLRDSRSCFVCPCVPFAFTLSTGRMLHQIDRQVAKSARLTSSPCSSEACIALGLPRFRRKGPTHLARWSEFLGFALQESYKQHGIVTRASTSRFRLLLHPTPLGGSTK